MLMSANQNFSEDQNLTSTGASTNIIDLGATGTVLGASAALTRDIGRGNPIEILIQLTADASGTSPTLDVALQMDTTAAFSSATTVASAVQIAGGSAGDTASIQFIPDGTTERYIRLNYTLGGTSPDYTVTAGIVAGRQDGGIAGAA